MLTNVFLGLPRLDDLAVGARAPQHAAHAHGADADALLRRWWRTEVRMSQARLIQTLHRWLCLMQYYDAPKVNMFLRIKSEIWCIVS